MVIDKRTGENKTKKIGDDNLQIYTELVRDYSEHISSVYFSAPGQASARSIINEQDTETMLDELLFIRQELGIPLTMLYNANCYGDTAISPKFEKEIAYFG